MVCPNNTRVYVPTYCIYGNDMHISAYNMYVNSINLYRWVWLCVVHNSLTHDTHMTHVILTVRTRGSSDPPSNRCCCRVSQQAWAPPPTAPYAHMRWAIDPPCCSSQGLYGRCTARCCCSDLCMAQQPYSSSSYIACGSGVGAAWFHTSALLVHDQRRFIQYHTAALNIPRYNILDATANCRCG